MCRIIETDAANAVEDTTLERFVLSIINAVDAVECAARHRNHSIRIA